MEPVESLDRRALVVAAIATTSDLPRTVAVMDATTLDLDGDLLNATIDRISGRRKMDCIADSLIVMADHTEDQVREITLDRLTTWPVADRIGTLVRHRADLAIDMAKAKLNVVLDKKSLVKKLDEVSCLRHAIRVRARMMPTDDITTLVAIAAVTMGHKPIGQDRNEADRSNDDLK